jgi:uncharacterized protein YcfL
MKKLLLLFITFLLTGCASNSGIVKISDDTYMYAKQSGWEQSGAAIKVQLYKEANEFCKAQGKKFVQISNQSNDGGPAKFTSAEIQFQCAE